MSDYKQSNSYKHAEAEMRLVGFYDEDSDYVGLIPGAVHELLETIHGQGHSGFSHSLVMQLFTKLANGEALTPLINDPEEWVKVLDEDGGRPALWQNRRQSGAFSNDGGKTYTLNSERDRPVHISVVKSKHDN